ncbi:PAS domain S-box protein [Geminicoccaceae bacterium 1502E]|nr:PAS domain S-box protein [Geminicoccaceae bacterium 1502E]
MSRFDRPPLPAEAWLAALVNGSSDAIVSKNLDGVITSWNGGAQTLFGWTAEEAVGQHIFMIAGPGNEGEMRAILQRVRQGERVGHYDTTRRHKSGRLVDVSLTVSPIRDASGTVVGASKIARDIGDRKRWEQQQQLLLEELNHRVRNTLATIQSLARHTSRGASSLPDFCDAFEARIGAMAAAHDMVVAGNWTGASIRRIASALLAPERSPDPAAWRIDLPEARVGPALALNLALALHELGTNALRHGALSRRGGTVCLTGHVEQGCLVLVWREQGGPLVEPPRDQGFGTILLARALAHQHQGRVDLDWRVEGLVCTIVVPLPPGAN